VYGYRLDIAHVQGTQHVESYHWELKNPQRGWELWCTRRMDHLFCKLTRNVSDYFDHMLLSEVHGAPPVALWLSELLEYCETNMLSWRVRFLSSKVTAAVFVQG
jgi:hypothetical protein